MVDGIIPGGTAPLTPDGLGAVLRAEAGAIAVTVDEKESYDADDMKVVEEDGRLRAIGKRLADADGVNAESIGLLAFRGDGAERFRAAIASRS